jgi:hypothetical protein
MWGRRRPRGTRLSRLLALGRLEEAMARAEQQEEEDEGEPEAMPYPRAGNPAPAGPAARPGHFAQDVPVDNSAAPAADPAAEADAAPQHHQELPGQRTRGSTRHGSFG